MYRLITSNSNGTTLSNGKHHEGFYCEGLTVCACVSFYSELLSSGVLKPFDLLIEGLKLKDGSRNYMTPLGMSSVVKHFLSESGTHPPDRLTDGQSDRRPT